QILAMNPDWTPDQVKGALMVSAQPYSGSAYQLGVGILSGKVAAKVTNPPNPNAGLDAYVVSDSNGSRAFDAAGWASAAQSNASWNRATWNSASWASASWASANSASASWASASWASASWASGQTTDGTLPSASWASMTWVK